MTGPRIKAPRNRNQIGIPKALTTHSLYPLYSTFFAGLGMEVVLSEVDPRGELKSNAGICFPAQIAHGAVFDLVQRGVELIFLPHVMRMPQREAWKESFYALSLRRAPISWLKLIRKFICFPHCLISVTVTPLAPL